MTVAPTIRAMDLFCGAGGSSTGMLQACDDAGVRLRLAAVNHWDVAIATHEANHPGADHFCVDVDHARMDKLAPDGVDILWGSPSCTEHSYAKGGKSIDDQKRASAWVMPRAVEAWNPKVVIVENVRNMLKWGPVEPVLDRKTGKPKIGKDGKVIIRPIKSKAGETFRAWFSAIESLGYVGKWNLLNAADYGEAQTRLRLFVVFTRLGYRFEYPAPSHGKPGTLEVERGLLQPWKAARKIIDFELESMSIFDRKTPLSPNTMRRIEAGIKRYCSGPIAEAFLVVLRNHADSQSLDGPIPTLAANGQHMGLATPELRPFVCGNRTNNVPKSVEDPLGTATTTTGGGFFLAEPEATAFVLGQQSNAVARDVDDPLPTVATGGKISLTEPSATPFVLGQHGGNVARSVDEPLSTIATAGYVRIFDPMIVDVRHGDRPHQPTGLDEPVNTVTSKNGMGIAEPFVIEPGRAVDGDVKPFLATYYGEQENGARTNSIDEPVPTVTTSNRFGMVEPFIVPQDTEAQNRGMDDPVPTIRTTSRGVRLVTPFLAAHFGERPNQEPRTHDIEQPLPTVTHRGAGDLVEAELIQPELTAAPADAPAGRTVIIDGKPYVLDIKFRMLQPKELARAQGFPDDYEFTGTKEARTAQIGNAVCVGVAKALMREALRAIFGDEIRAAA